LILSSQLRDQRESGGILDSFNALWVSQDSGNAVLIAKVTEDLWKTT